MSIADMCLMDAQMKGIKTACFREFQNSIDDSCSRAYYLVEIERLGLETGANGFEVQNQSNFNYNNEVSLYSSVDLARNPEGNEIYARLKTRYSGWKKPKRFQRTR
jgi:hypothetical protein